MDITIVKQRPKPSMADRIKTRNIAVTVANDHIIKAVGPFDVTCQNFDEQEQEILFCEKFTGKERYFFSTISKVLLAEHHLCRNFALTGQVSLNDFYNLLGLDLVPTKDILVNGESMGWSCDQEIMWIDFHHEQFTYNNFVGYLIDCSGFTYPVNFDTDEF
jgi:hypothetical protein